MTSALCISYEISLIIASSHLIQRETCMPARTFSMLSLRVKVWLHLQGAMICSAVGIGESLKEGVPNLVQGKLQCITELALKVV